MAEHNMRDRVQETSTTVGTGPYVLGGAASAGLRTFSAAFGGTGTFANIPYAAVEDSGDWEVGLGTFVAASNTLSRDQIIDSSQTPAGDPGVVINWPSGTRNVWVTLPGPEAMLKAENLAGLEDSSEALDNLGAGSAGKLVLAAVDAAGARSAIQAVGTVGGDTITGSLIVQDLHMQGAEVDSGFSLAFGNANGGVLLDSGDQGRFAVLLNATAGASPTFVTGGVNAVKLEITALGGLRMFWADGSGAAADDPITWSEVFRAEPTELLFNGQDHPFPAGTKVVFYQAAAPAGWTQDSGVNDRVLRVVSGAGGGTGGSWTISGLTATTTVDGHALTESEMPTHSHGHGYAVTGGVAAGTDSIVKTNFVGGDTLLFTNTAGSGSAHTHTASTSISSSGAWKGRYADVIVCSYDG